MITAPAPSRAGRRWPAAPSRALATAVAASLACLAHVLPAATEKWQAIPLSPNGGEACQVIQAITVAPSLPSLLFMGTDVAGIYRSTDGAASWHPINNNLSPKGATDIAVDPLNPDRVLLAGANDPSRSFHGIWLSTDRGASWTEALPYSRSGYRDFRRSIAYDRSSYDSSLGRCQIAYWSSDTHLYKTIDGGQSWAIVNSTLGKSSLRMHPEGDWLYAANSAGFHRSADGVSFTLLQAGNFRSVEVMEGATGTNADRVWAGTTARTFYYSSASGSSPVANVISATVPSTAAITSIAVNPANADQITVNASTGSTGNDLYRSLDGGLTWAKSVTDTTGIFSGDSNREGRVVWASSGALHGVRGSHFLVKSTDAGTNLAVTNNGFTGSAIDSGFQFNVFDPDILFLPMVDFNGAQTTDGGATWTRMIDMDRQNTGTTNWGWVRAGYSLTADIIYGAASESWSPYRQDFRRTTTRAQTNGGSAGSQWTTIDYTSINTDSNRVHSSLGDPIFPAAASYYNYLTLDQGQTWTAMSDVRAVLTHDRTVVLSGGVENKALSRQWIGVRSFTTSSGTQRSAIVRATRQLDAQGNLTGVVWNDVPGAVFDVSWFTDVAYDHLNDLYYATDSSRNRLLRFDAATQTWTNLAANTPADQFGARIFWSVAVDPLDPTIVYAAGSQNGYCNTNAVVRSTDSGATWTRLTADVAEFGTDGARNAVWVRVHPGTREAWFGTSCYGLWKIARPGGVTGVSTVYAENFDAQTTGSAPSGLSVTHSNLVTVAAVPSATDKSLRIQDPNNYTAPGATRDLGENLVGIVNVKLRVRHSAVAAWQRPLTLSDSSGTVALSLVVNGGALRVEESGGAFTTVKSGLVANTWYEVTVVADTVADACDIYVDGVLVLSGHPFRNAVAHLRQLGFASGTSTSGADLYIDDILVAR